MWNVSGLDISLDNLTSTGPKQNRGVPMSQMMVSCLFWFDQKIISTASCMSCNGVSCCTVYTELILLQLY